MIPYPLTATLLFACDYAAHVQVDPCSLWGLEVWTVDRIRSAASYILTLARYALAVGLIPINIFGLGTL
jgi:hypothetical protein